MHTLVVDRYDAVPNPVPKTLSDTWCESVCALRKASKDLRVTTNPCREMRPRISWQCTPTGSVQHEWGSDEQKNPRHRLTPALFISSCACSNDKRQERWVQKVSKKSRTLFPRDHAGRLRRSSSNLFSNSGCQPIWPSSAKPWCLPRVKKGSLYRSDRKSTRLH